MIASADLASDGVNEVIECVPAWNSDAGAVDVFDGATQSLIVRFVGAAGSRFGWSCATVPDINGDGLAELLIGAPGEQRAYLALGPFVDVAELQVDASRLNLILEPASGMPTVNFGLDVGGLHDLDGDTRPDLRVAAMELDANGDQHSVTLVFQGVTGALVGIGRRALPSDTLEAASGDADKDATVGGTDMARVIEALGTATDAGATKGDVTLDGAVDGEDVGLVLDELGTELYLEVDPDLGTCGAETYRVEARGESLCIEVIARSTLAAELTVSSAPADEIDPTEIIHPFQNHCGDRIRDCLGKQVVKDAVQLVAARCWPNGPPNTVIGRIYCVPCMPLEPVEGEPDLRRGGETLPFCAWFQDRRVDISICDDAGGSFCEALAHELIHVSQACELGSFSMSCEGFAMHWHDRRRAICAELEAYANTTDCATSPVADCCERACISAREFWQSGTERCRACCQLLVANGCCADGRLLHGCVPDTSGVCAVEGSP